MDQWISGEPTARSEVSAILQNHGLDETAIEAEAMMKSLPILIALTQLQVSQIAVRDKGLSGLAFCSELLMRRAPSGEANPPPNPPRAERILDQRDHKHDH